MTDKQFVFQKKQLLSTEKQSKGNEKCLVRSK